MVGIFPRGITESQIRGKTDIAGDIAYRSLSSRAYLTDNRYPCYAEASCKVLSCDLEVRDRYRYIRVLTVRDVFVVSAASRETLSLARGGSAR